MTSRCEGQGRVPEGGGGGGGWFLWGARRQWGSFRNTFLKFL